MLPNKALKIFISSKYASANFYSLSAFFNSNSKYRNLYNPRWNLHFVLLLSHLLIPIFQCPKIAFKVKNARAWSKRFERVAHSSYRVDVLNSYGIQIAFSRYRSVVSPLLRGKCSSWCPFRPPWLSDHHPGYFVNFRLLEFAYCQSVYA